MKTLTSRLAYEDIAVLRLPYEDIEWMSVLNETSTRTFRFMKNWVLTGKKKIKLKQRAAI